MRAITGINWSFEGIQLVMLRVTALWVEEAHKEAELLVESQIISITSNP